jgi:hypothetical protein
VTADGDAVRAALCKQPHSWPWWAYNLAWANLQRANHARWERREKLLTNIQPEHYAFLAEMK